MRERKERDEETGRFISTTGVSFARLAERLLTAGIREHLTCEACGRTFAASRIDALYCCGACRQKAYRRRC
jgi:ribosomal protein L37AE/L43A